MDLAICAIFKNEAPYLAEWLAFHTVMGVEHFFLYNNNSDDNWAKVLKPWHDVVSIRIWPGQVQQMPAYTHCVNSTEAQKYRWVAFIDVDEFLWSPINDNLVEMVDRFGDFPGVCANWLMFGPNGHETKPEGLTLENYTTRPPDDFKPNGHVKTICKPSQVIRFGDPHFAMYLNGQRSVNENFQPVYVSNSFPVSHSRLRINHYFTRSREEFVGKVKRGRADSIEHLRRIEEIEGYTDQSVTDTAILRHVPSVVRELEKRYQCPVLH